MSDNSNQYVIPLAQKRLLIRQFDVAYITAVDEATKAQIGRIFDYAVITLFLMTKAFGGRWV